MTVREMQRQNLAVRDSNIGAVPGADDNEVAAQVDRLHSRHLFREQRGPVLGALDDAGAAGFLRKPIESKSLLDLVERSVGT